MFLSFRVIGPAMPSAELLAAAAKLTEAEAELRYVNFFVHKLLWSQLSEYNFLNIPVFFMLLI